MSCPLPEFLRRPRNLKRVPPARPATSAQPANGQWSVLQAELRAHQLRIARQLLQAELLEELGSRQRDMLQQLQRQTAQLAARNQTLRLARLVWRNMVEMDREIVTRYTAGGLIITAEHSQTESHPGRPPQPHDQPHAGVEGPEPEQMPLPLFVRQRLIEAPLLAAGSPKQPQRKFGKFHRAAAEDGVGMHFPAVDRSMVAALSAPNATEVTFAVPIRV